MATNTFKQWWARHSNIDFHDALEAWEASARYFVAEAVEADRIIVGLRARVAELEGQLKNRPTVGAINGGAHHKNTVRFNDGFNYRWVLSEGGETSVFVSAPSVSAAVLTLRSIGCGDSAERAEYVQKVSDTEMLLEFTELPPGFLEKIPPRPVGPSNRITGP